MINNIQKPTGKVCSNCKIYKEYSEFGKHSYSHDGYRARCKSCKRSFDRKWENDRKGYRNVEKRDRARNKRLAFLTEKAIEYRKSNIPLPRKSKQRVIAWFSCGAASAVATILALEDYGSENVDIVYQDTGSEHPDNHRFLLDCQTLFGQPITTIKNKKYKDTWDVWEKIKYLGSSRGAACSGELKRKLAEEYINWGNNQQIEIFGYTLEEELRVSKFKTNNNERIIDAPLIRYGLTKQNCFDILKKKGLKRPIMYDLGFNNANCLAGETKIITNKGAVSISSIVNQPTSIRTSKGFEVVTVKDYGLMRCYEIDIFRNGMIQTIIASYNHRWFVRPRCYRDELVEVPTFALQVGFAIPTAYKGAVNYPDDEGIRHGIVFGNGNYQNRQKKYSTITLCGKKIELKKYFPNFKDKKNKITGLPAKYKKIPSLSETPEYLAGFIAGLIATDGCFSIGISLSQKNNIPEIKQICEAIGLTVQPTMRIEGSTNYIKYHTLDILTIVSASFPPSLDIRNQRKNFRPNHRADDCKIIDIRKIKNKKVYCPTTSTSDIVLEYGIITGQCIACPKGSKGYFQHLKTVFPSEFERMAKLERKLGYSVLTQVIEGKTTKLFLDELPQKKKGEKLDHGNMSCGFLCGTDT